MIVYLQRHIAAFTGKITYMIVPVVSQQIVSIAGAVPPPVEDPHKWWGYSTYSETSPGTWA